MKAVTIDPKRLAVIEAVSQENLGALSKQGDKISSLAAKRRHLQIELHRLRTEYVPGARGDALNNKIRQAEAEIEALTEQIHNENAAQEPLREASTASGTLYNRCVEFLEGLK